MVQLETYRRVAQRVRDGERLKLCLQCGSCSGICPMGFAMEDPPHRIVAALRAGQWDRVLRSETVWLCAACYACNEACPAKIPLADGLLAQLKSDQLETGQVPSELQDALENLRRYGNVFGESPKRRTAWTEALDESVPVMAKHRRKVDVLWYVGDYASYHPRVQRSTIALAEILQRLGVSFGILGPEEQGDGDAMRLIGETGLFEMLARKNARALARYEFDVVVTGDPHALHAFRHAYPSLGIEFVSQHYTEFLAERLSELEALLVRPVETPITYHDPCYLGRASELHVYEPPRALLRAIPGALQVEMPHNRENALCCGGGGGGMWLDGFVWDHARARSSEWRVEEARRVGARTLAVACPYEAPRFEDAVKNLGLEGSLAVRDVAELLREAMYD